MFWGRVMVQTVSRQSVIAESGVRFQVNPCEMCGGKSDTFIRILLFSLSIQCFIVFSVYLLLLPEGKRANHGNFPTDSAVTEIGANLERRVA